MKPLHSYNNLRIGFLASMVSQHLRSGEQKIRTTPSMVKEKTSADCQFSSSS